MEQSNKKRSTLGLWIDWSFIIRVVGRWFIPILSLASVLTLGTYIVCDRTMKDTCTVSALVAVVPREYNNSTLASYSNDSALGRNINMWNSNSMLKVIRDLDKNITLNGELYAYVVGGTNLVKVEATANTAQDAFYLLNGAIRNYRKIVNNFDETHLTVVLTDIIKSEVSVIKPDPMRYAVLIFAGTVCGCIGLLGLWTLATNLLHNEEQANDVLNVPVFESFQKIRKRRKNGTVLITDQKIPIDFAEAVDRCAARIGQYMTSHGQKTLMVTSVHENEGKSTVSVNLAMSLAQKGNRTLLIDMDFRDPGINKMLKQGTEEVRTCSNGLQKGKKLADSIIHRDDCGNLDVIFQFHPIADADQYLETTNLKEQLAELSQIYDFIIINTAPMGPVRDTDVIAQRAEASFLVIREEYEQAALVNEVIDQLDEFGTDCIGAVMNQCKRLRSRRLSKKGYSYARNHFRKEKSK